ncbi:hypothetical protein EC99P2_00028 [Enterococcus phage EC99P2]|nr:hypothetical protein EC99P2_00028 [Enterococcus phage EC99P2]
MAQYRVSYIDYKDRQAVGYLCADALVEAEEYAQHAQGVKEVIEVKEYEVQATRLSKDND